jgi:predicted enzyme related to lactoylglutathione lyase
VTQKKGVEELPRHGYGLFAAKIWFKSQPYKTDLVPIVIVASAIPELATTNAAARFGPDYASFFDGRLAGGFTADRPAPAHGLLLVIYTSDLSAAQRKIEAAGGAIVKDTFSFPGGRRFHFMDPSGIELAVWSDVGESFN